MKCIKDKGATHKFISEVILTSKQVQQLDDEEWCG
jgi:hypothetical protein